MMRNKRELRQAFLHNRLDNKGHVRNGYEEKLRQRVGNFTWGKLDILGAAKVELAMRELAGDTQVSRALDALMEVWA